MSIDGIGVLLRGAPGAGKSDLGLRLIDAGALLVADDQVDLTARDGLVTAAPPPATAGMLEVRGIGLVELPYVEEVPLRLIVDLLPAGQVKRLPATAWCAYLGCRIRLIEVAPFEASASVKVRIAARSVIGTADTLSGARLRCDGGEEPGE